MTAAKDVPMQDPIDALVLVPLPEESVALRTALGNPQDKGVEKLFSWSEWRNVRIRNKGNRGKIVAITPFDQDQLPAANAVHLALKKWAPQCLVIVGIAGAISKLKLGDVLVTRHGFHMDAKRKIVKRGSRTVEALAPTPVSLNSWGASLGNAFKSDDALMRKWKDDCIRNVPKDIRRTRPPELLVDDTASGSAVIDAPAPRRRLSRFSRKMLNVENELAGAASAFKAVTNSDMILMIRGSSDLAKGKGKTDRIGSGAWRKYAAQNAASLLKTLLRAFGLPTDIPSTAGTATVSLTVTFQKVQRSGSALTIGGSALDVLGHIGKDIYPRTSQPAVTDLQTGGLLECVGPPASGKSTFALQVIDHALAQNRHVFWCDASSPAERIGWPPSVRAKSVALLDNVHLLEDSSIRQLIDSRPPQMTLIALSRSAKIEPLYPSTCKRLILNHNDLRAFIVSREAARAAIREGASSLVENIASAALDWLEAHFALSGMSSNRQALENAFKGPGGLGEYLRYETRKRLTTENLVENPVLMEMACFNFLDLKLTPRELDETGDRERSLRQLMERGWVPQKNTQLGHPKVAERILRALDVLTTTDDGRKLGSLLANVLMRSNGTSDRLGEIRRHARYGGLPQCKFLLSQFNQVLLDNAAHHRIPLDVIHIDQGSELRRGDQLESALGELQKVSTVRRGSTWRYEYAYVHFLKGSPRDLLTAETSLKPDLDGDLNENSFMNRGLFAKVLARREKLESAYDLLFTLSKHAAQIYGEDAKRWTVNMAAHLHEYAVGLAAHDISLVPQADDRLKELLQLVEGNRRPWTEYSLALHAALKGDADQVVERTTARINSIRENKANGEQKASFLALLGAGYETLGQNSSAREVYARGLALPEYLDNRRGMSWARKRSQVNLATLEKPLSEVLKVLMPWNSPRRAGRDKTRI